MSVVNDATSEANLLGYPSVKDEQLKVVTNVVYGKDVFAVLPTGYGKSLCFALLPGMFDRVMGVAMSIVVVLRPLIALIKDQVRLNGRNI